MKTRSQLILEGIVESLSVALDHTSRIDSTGPDEVIKLCNAMAK
jgi:hypothetical protein